MLPWLLNPVSHNLRLYKVKGLLHPLMSQLVEEETLDLVPRSFLVTVQGFWLVALEVYGLFCLPCNPPRVGTGLLLRLCGLSTASLQHTGEGASGGQDSSGFFFLESFWVTPLAVDRILLQH